MHELLTFYLSIGLLFLIIILLIIELGLHHQNLKRIPVRISVTGTRGKTTTVRMLAAILRESGYRVLAKTTGTSPNYILPDGSEEVIKRFGVTSILEQKKLVRKAAGLKVDYMIAEVMSIQAENHKVESQMLLQANYTLITNIRPDHLDHFHPEQMSKMVVNDIRKDSTVILPESCFDGEMERLLTSQNVKVVCAKSLISTAQNAELASCMARELGINSEIIKKGINNSKMDLGEALIYRFEGKNCPVYFVNGFAANDPISSELLLDEILSRDIFHECDLFGLFALRKDRGERSQQWLEYLKGGKHKRYNYLFFTGVHGRALIRSLGFGEIMHAKSAKTISDRLIDRCQKPTVIIGLVNIVGLGAELIKYWDQEGKGII